MAEYELVDIGYWDHRTQYAIVAPGGRQIAVLSCATDDVEFDGDWDEALAEMVRYGELIVEGLNRIDP